MVNTSVKLGNERQRISIVGSFNGGCVAPRIMKNVNNSACEGQFSKFETTIIHINWIIAYLHYWFMIT